jgi:hypothetical protein
LVRLALSCIWFANYDLFSARQINSRIHIEIWAIGDFGPTNAASKIIIAWLAFGIVNGSPFLTFSFSMSGFTSSDHPIVIESISKLPGEACSSSIL